MSVIPLSGEENLAVLSDEFVNSMKNLDRGTEQKEVLKEIRKLVESRSPNRYIYEKAEGCDILEVMRASDPLRIYCKLVEGVPRQNKTYNLLFLFYVDKHKYRNRKLTDMDEAAKRQVKLIRECSSLGAVNDYLKQRQALDEDDLNHLIENGGNAFS